MKAANEAVRRRGGRRSTDVIQAARCARTPCCASDIDERARVDAAADGDQLREDADGDFGRRDGADVEADRRVHAVEALGGMPSASSASIDARDLGAAADQAEVVEVARRQRAQRVEVVRGGRA